MTGAVRKLDPVLHTLLDGFGMGRQWREIGPQWDRPPGQTHSVEPFVIRWSSHLGELEDGRQFCVGCGRLLDAWTEDGRCWWRRADEDGQEHKRAVAGQRKWIEAAIPPRPARPDTDAHDGGTDGRG